MTATVEDIRNKAFDYVVIGGGTAGLVVAARLTEDPAITVAVLEAGKANTDDPLIKIPAQFGKQFGNSNYDWGFQTVPQKHSSDKTYYWPSGKTLGGSSAINFLVWSKPPRQDIDAWERLGNPGWNWEQYSKYSKRVETFTTPKDANAQQYRQVFNPDSHGYSGPIRTSFPDFIMAGEVPFQETLLNCGIKVAQDPCGGDPTGTHMATSTIHPVTHTRSYAAPAYYLPNKDRPNLHVLCEAFVRRIITEPREDGDPTRVKAVEVEFDYDGGIHTVHVNREVVLSSGAVKSPQILELSGIGDEKILSPLGIKTVVNLPGVGANLQEHVFCGAAYELDAKHGFETLDALTDREFAAAQLLLHAEGKGIHRLGLSGYTFVPLSAVTPTPDIAHELISKQRRQIEAKLNSGDLPPGLKEQFYLQLEKLDKGDSGDCEIICIPQYFSSGTPETGKGYVTIVAAINHPFSRGTIHIQSSDPHVYPEIDPHYFENDFDLEVFTETFKFVRRLQKVEPFKSMIAKEVSPGPQCTSDEDVRSFIKENMGTTFHHAGTNSMLPRRLNGVVDPNLLVYGSKNIRIADLSIAPLHICAHTQATAYTIGERAAEIIRTSNTEHPKPSGLKMVKMIGLSRLWSLIQGFLRIR